MRSHSNVESAVFCSRPDSSGIGWNAFGPPRAGWHCPQLLENPVSPLNYRLTIAKNEGLLARGGLHSRRNGAYDRPLAFAAIFDLLQTAKSFRYSHVHTCHLNL